LVSKAQRKRRLKERESSGGTLGSMGGAGLWGGKFGQFGCRTQDQMIGGPLQNLPVPRGHHEEEILLINWKGADDDGGRKKDCKRLLKDESAKKGKDLRASTNTGGTI